MEDESNHRVMLAVGGDTCEAGGISQICHSETGPYSHEWVVLLAAVLSYMQAVVNKPKATSRCKLQAAARHRMIDQHLSRADDDYATWSASAKPGSPLMSGSNKLSDPAVVAPRQSSFRPALLVSKQLLTLESSISCHSGTGSIAEDNTQKLEHRMPPKAYAAVVEPLSPSPPPLTAQSIDDAQDILVVSDIMDTLDQIPSELTRVHSDLNELGAVLFCESTSSPSWSA
jgi:hypothetical protein